MVEIFIASAGVFLAELYGNFVGGGSLLTQAVLQGMLHMDIREAMALDNASVMGANIGMLIMLFRKNTLKTYFIPIVFSQILAAFAGVWIMVHLPNDVLQVIFLIAIIGVVIHNFFFTKKEKKQKGFIATPQNIMFLSIFTFFLGVYNAGFVIGDWIIALAVLTGVFHFKYHNAVFMLIATESIMKPFSIWAYYENGLLHFNFLIPMILSTLISGLIAGYFLEKIHSNILEKILKYISIILVLYLFWSIIYT